MFGGLKSYDSSRFRAGPRACYATYRALMRTASTAGAARSAGPKGAPRQVLLISIEGNCSASGRAADHAQSRSLVRWSSSSQETPTPRSSTT